MKTLVLAAGLGTRLRPLTDHIPKALAPVAGRPVIERLLDRIGGDVVVNTHHHAAQLHARLGDRVEWSDESELLGTAGALRGAGLDGGGDVMVLSGDGVHDVDLAALATHHRESGAAATITVKRLADPSQCAQVELNRGLVRRFVEKPDEDFTELASIGIYCFGPAAIAHVPADRPSDNARDLIPALLAAGLPVAAYETHAFWSDIGAPEELLAVNLALAAGEPRIHDGCEIAGELEGACQVGPGATVARGARVREALVLPGARVAGEGTGICGDPAAVAEAWRRW